jgi:hypothetical protein
VQPGGGGAPGSLVLVQDPELGRENPAEAKFAKLRRSLSRGVVDRRLKPDTGERQRIEAVLDYPPNRCARPPACRGAGGRATIPQAVEWGCLR